MTNYLVIKNCKLLVSNFSLACMKNKKQKYFFNILKGPATIVILLSLLMVAFFVMSQGSSAGDLKGQLETGLNYATASGLGTRDIREVIFLIINILLGFLGVVAVLIVMYGGFVWMTSAGDPNKIDRAKQIMVNGAIGLIIIFASYSLAAFIIRLFVGGAGPGNSGFPGGVGAPCTNCNALGSGIIESVYPAPGSVGVPRNTAIYVTFKESISAGIIKGGGELIVGENNVQIYYTDPATKKKIVLQPITDIGVSSPDNKTFLFKPVKILGDGVNNILYRVRLGKDIKKEGGDPAFPKGDHFEWSFTVGTKLDLVPPFVTNVFPNPDDVSDDYSTKTPKQAQGKITVTGAPKTLRPGSASIVRTAPPPEDAAAAIANLVGSYSGSFDGSLVLTGDINPARCAGDVHLSATWIGGDSTGLPNFYCISGNSVVLEGGTAITFDKPILVGNQWAVSLVGFQQADTLQVSNTVFTFVNGVPVGRQIQVPALGAGFENNLADNIRTAINELNHSPDVNASVVANIVTVQADLAGTFGNNISLISSSPNISTTAMLGGVDASTASSPKGVKDESRDSIIKIDLSEVMMPNTIGGKVKTDVSNAVKGVGSIIVGSDFEMIRVQADLDGDGFEADEYVSGEFNVSNLYGTTEFKPSTVCGICNGGSKSGVSCSEDANCPGGTCEPVRNTCGEFKYCLPTRDPSDVVGGVTHYRVTLRAANLDKCVDDNSCGDNKYNTCDIGGSDVCQDVSDPGKPLNYPQGETQPKIDGVLDASLNSLDGDFDENTEGPSDPGHNHKVDPKGNNGDTFYWDFWINNSINSNPPHIRDIGDINVSPAPLGGSGVNLVTNPEALFDELLMSQTLKSGNNYRDGVCGDCTADAECPFPAEQSCVESRCVSKIPGRENYCMEDDECTNGMKCFQKRYVNLIDSGCVINREIYKTGWWVTSRGRDTIKPYDGFYDNTSAIIKHTPFCEVTRYGVEMGSGIRDVHQNCYIPSGSVGAGISECKATQSEPFCCNGFPTASPNCSP